MTNKPLWLLFALGVGCGTAIETTVKTTVINPAPRPLASRDPASVEVFSSAPPQRPHVDVEYLEAEAEAESGLSADGTPRFIAALRAKAATDGCDAIVLGGTTNYLTSGGKYGTNLKRIVATCVVYT